MKLNEFLEKQESIFQKFRTAEERMRIGEIGIEPDPALINKIGAHVIVGYFGTNPAIKVEKFSEKIARVIPSVSYDRNACHLSIVALAENDLQNPDPEKIERLNKAVKHVQPPRDCRVEFKGSLVNQNCAILEGKPNQDYCDLVSKVLEGCEKEGISVKPPWGSYVTFIRFNSNVSSENLSPFWNIIDEERKTEPYFECKIGGLAVGHCTASPESFNLFRSELYRIVWAEDD